MFVWQFCLAILVAQKLHFISNCLFLIGGWNSKLCIFLSFSLSEAFREKLLVILDTCFSVSCREAIRTVWTLVSVWVFTPNSLTCGCSLCFVLFIFLFALPFLIQFSCVDCEIFPILQMNFSNTLSWKQVPLWRSVSFYCVNTILTFHLNNNSL